MKKPTNPRPKKPGPNHAWRFGYATPKTAKEAKQA